MAVTSGSGAIAEVDLIISQGADNSFEFIYAAGDPAEPVDLTGWTAASMIRRSQAAASFWYKATTADNITLGADGRVTIKIPHSVTETEAWESYDQGVWDLELSSPIGNKIRLVEGKVVVSHDVTRDA